MAKLQQTPEVAQKSIDDLQNKVETLKQKYEQLKEDVKVKLAMLDENRLSLMREHLANLGKSLHQYFTNNLNALTQLASKPKPDENNSISQFDEERRPSFVQQ